MLRINNALLDEIRAHGARAYPHECCGAMLGRDSGEHREVLELLPVVNQRADSPHNRFAVTPRDVLRAEQTARARGWEVLGWYHSHPDHPALPSEYDREHAWPWYSYVIVGVEQGEAKQVSSWRLAEDRSRFRFEEMEIRAAAESRK